MRYSGRSFMEDVGRVNLGLSAWLETDNMYLG